jgi:hypothetical protein
MSQTLDESTFIIPMAWGYRLVRSTLSDQDRAGPADLCGGRYYRPQLQRPAKYPVLEGRGYCLRRFQRQCRPAAEPVGPGL